MKSRIFLIVVLALVLTSFMASLGLSRPIKEMHKLEVEGDRVVYSEGRQTHVLTRAKGGAVIDTVYYAVDAYGPAYEHYDVLDYPFPGDSVIVFFAPIGACSLTAVAGYFAQDGGVDLFVRFQDDPPGTPKNAYHLYGPSQFPADVAWGITKETWDWYDIKGLPAPYQFEIPSDQPFWIGYVTEDIGAGYGGPQIYWDYYGFHPTYATNHWNFTYGYAGWYRVSYGPYGIELNFKAVLNYYAGTHPLVANVTPLNDTYKTSDFDTVFADALDLDGTIVSVDLFYKVGEGGAPASVPMVAASPYKAAIPGTYAPGDTVYYWVVATDDDATTNIPLEMSFLVLEPECHCAEILLIDAGALDIDFYFDLDVLSHSYCYEYWSIADHGGIDGSVVNYGWHTIILTGWGTGEIPTRGYAGNIYADFIQNGGNLLYIDMDYFYAMGEPFDPTFGPGDFAWDFFGIEGGYNDAISGWPDHLICGVPGDVLTDDFDTDCFTTPGAGTSYEWTDLAWAPPGGATIFDDYGLGAGTRNTNGTWHTVYLSWNIEGCGEPAKASLFLKNVFEYFGTKRPIVVDIGEVEDAYPCQADVQIPVTIDNCPDIGGYDVLIWWDCTLAELLDVTDDQGFEFFNWTTWQVDDGCKVRIVGLADKPNDQDTDPLFGCTGEKTLFTLHFHPSNTWDLNYSIPIEFETDECGDNTFSDVTGYILYTTSADCPAEVPPGKPDPFNPAVTLFNGYISAEYLNRYEFVGDINLNGTKYEVADATLYLEYLNGEATLIDEDRQRTASDVNIDGTPWSIADVVLLIDIINGYATPLAKPVPTAEVASVSISGNVVAANFDVPVGGVYFIIKHAGEVGEPVLGARAEGMDLAWSDKNGELRVILYSWESKRIEPGSGVLFTVPGATNLTTSEVQFSDANGSLMKVGSVPSEFALAQNYPNPFNPNTNIAFDLAKDVNVELSVYNAVGQKIATLVNGEMKAGHHTVAWNASSVASGVYFYAIKAGDFTATRKMVFMK